MFMSSIKLIKGSCVDQNVDAIVNAANGYMMHGGGVARAILLKAGPKLNEACRNYDLPIKDGEVIVTPAFNIINAKLIIHAVGPDFRVTPDAFDKLTLAYYNSLIALKSNGYHSISFPLISSAIFAGNLKNAVSISTASCIDAYNRFISEYKYYDIEVLLCAYDDNEYKILNKETNSSLTIFTNTSPGLRLVATSLPKAFSLTLLINSFTTL